MHSTRGILKHVMSDPFAPVLRILLGVALIAASLPLAAQETTSPELRDFRLDPKPEAKPVETPLAPAPKIEPVPAPKVEGTPPPVNTPTVTVKAPAPSAPQALPKAAPPVAQKIRDEAGPEPEIKAEALPKPDETVAQTPVVEAPQPETADRAEPAPVVNPTSPVLPMWIILLGSGTVATLAALWLLRRRKAIVASDDAFEERFVAADPAPVEGDDTTATVQTAQPVPSPCRIEAVFTPESAHLSIGNLTISGRLALRNSSDETLRDVTVRTSMISACDGQRETIRLFHADSSRGHVEKIGDAQAGEEIALALEIQQPRVELNEFDWRQRRFLAPIVLINLSGNGPGGIETCELSCLIGREATPQAQRLKPFHTDRGPQRFKGLAQHLV
jgi:hypothetical protein